MSDHIRIKQEIHESLQHYSTILQIPLPKLVFSTNKSFGGRNDKNALILNQPIIENWDNERKACEFVLAHELVHAKYGESSSNFEGFKSVLIPSVSVKLAFSELRANIMAYEITESNELDLKHYFSNFYPYAITAFMAYTGGYLKGNEYVEFIRQHPKWTTQTVKDAAIYFKNYCLWYKLVRKNNYLKLQQKFS